MHSFSVISFADASLAEIWDYSLQKSDEQSYTSNKAQSDFLNDYLTFFRAMKDFKKIKANWDSYGGLPPSDSAQNIILELLDALFSENLLPTRIGLTPEGGTLLEISNNKVYHLFEVYADGEIVHLKKNQLGKITTENILVHSFSTVCQNIFYEIRGDNQLLRVGYSVPFAPEWKTISPYLRSFGTLVS